MLRAILYSLFFYKYTGFTRYINGLQIQITMKAILKSALKQGFIYAFLASMALAFVFFVYIFNGQNLDFMDFTGWVYYATSCFTHAAIIMFVPYIALFLPLIFCKIKPQIANILLTIIYSFIFILAISNSFVYNIYHFHINGLVIKMLTSSGASDIFVFSTSMYVKAFVIILGLIALSSALCWSSYWIESRIRFKGFYRKMLLPILLVALISQSIHIYGGATMKTSVVESTEVIPYYFPIRMNSFLSKLGIVDKNKLNQIRFQNSETAVVYPLHSLKIKPVKQKLNVVILCIDSWNKRTMNEECTPYIYRFAQKAENFTQHLSSSNATSGGIFGMFTGVSAYYWKSFDFGNVQPVMVEQLLKAGYKVQAYPSATLEYPPFAKLLFKNVKGLNIKTEGKTPYDRDIQITKNFLSDLEKYDGKQPFFSFVFYDLPHAMEMPKEKLNKFKPTWETPDYMALNNDTDPTPFFNLYKNCVAQVDQLIGSILTRMEQKGMLENTLIIITGDHSQEFNENHNNYWGHASNYSQWQTAVPMIYYAPKCKPGKRNYRTTHYDISPTILQQTIGVQNPTSDYSMGKNLHDSASRDWHLVGSDLYYAFILNDGTIVEKQGTGNIKIMDKQMNTISDYPLDARKLNQVIMNMNRFFKK